MFVALARSLKMRHELMHRHRLQSGPVGEERHELPGPGRAVMREEGGFCFPMKTQLRVWQVVNAYVAAAEAYLDRLPKAGCDVNGNPLQCRATTRKGTACQRVPLPHNGYCPSHQHLAETEEIEVEELVAA